MERLVETTIDKNTDVKTPVALLFPPTLPIRPRVINSVYITDQILLNMSQQPLSSSVQPTDIYGGGELP